MTDDDLASGSSEHGGEVGEKALAPAEQALLDAALEFYGAADGVIDHTGERPQLRQDAAGFEAIRCAMAGLEERVVAARAAGATPERIARIARMEPETIVLILERRDAAPSPADG